ncbi:MAG: hypothetical protein HY974_02855 [Candidatus Kerfeldbacteria bacterium]|nr:hypothetical protein [Candidatus Kerfeldbacteria bacterium]
MSQQSLKREIIQKVSELATAGFGLVAALAWNDAIQSLFKEIFGTQSAIWAKFAYAVLVTVLVVIIALKLGQALNKIKEIPP